MNFFTRYCPFCFLLYAITACTPKNQSHFSISQYDQPLSITQNKENATSFLSTKSEVFVQSNTTTETTVASITTLQDDDTPHYNNPGNKAPKYQNLEKRGETKDQPLSTNAVQAFIYSCFSVLGCFFIIPYIFFGLLARKKIKSAKFDIEENGMRGRFYLKVAEILSVISIILWIVCCLWLTYGILHMLGMI